MMCKAISEYFFENLKKINNDKVFLYLEDEKITYKQIREKCYSFIFSIIKKDLLDYNFYISSSLPETVIVSFLALNYINKDVYIISENVKLLLFDDTSKSNEKIVFITDNEDLNSSFDKSVNTYVENRYIYYFENFVNKNYDEKKLTEYLSTIIERYSSLIQFTSGTTGRPSKIIRTKESCNVEGIDLVKIWEYDSDSRVACFTSFSYSFAFGNVVIACILASASIISCKKFNIKNVCLMLKKYNATHFVTVVSIIKLLLIQKDKQELSFLKYLICSGSKLNKRDECRFHRKFKVHISEQYGMTETGALLYSYISKDYFMNSFPSVDCRIENNNLYITRKNTNLQEIKTNDYVIKKKKNYIKILGRTDSVLKLDDKRYSVEYISSLFANEDYLTIAKKLLSNKKIVLNYNKENKQNVKSVVSELKKLDSSIKIKRKIIK